MRHAATRFAVLSACAALASALCGAQEPQPAYPGQQPAYPAQSAYPAQQPVYQDQLGYAQPADGRKGRMRQFFATTLAAVLQGSGVSTTVGLSDMVAGGLTDWFDRKRRRKQERAQPAPGSQGIQPNYQAGQFPQQTDPSQAGAPPVTYDSQAYTPQPNPPATDPYASQYAPQAVDVSAQYAPVQYYDTQTGALTNVAPSYADAAGIAYPNASLSAPAGSFTPPADNTLFAGIAYEVHALDAAGNAVPVNPANHEFHSGDQFIVMYRPSLPGRMRVVNVNPAGRETEIDSVDVAAGQLMRLGPYRFEAQRGDESLRFTITPCSSPALMLATRDIVRVDTAGTGTALNLDGCNTLATRSIRGPRTRDIRKVAVEGTTGFAFDPVSAQELSTGEFAPRELNVMFHHR